MIKMIYSVHSDLPLIITVPVGPGQNQEDHYHPVLSLLTCLLRNAAEKAFIPTKFRRFTCWRFSVIFH